MVRYVVIVSRGYRYPSYPYIFSENPVNAIVKVLKVWDAILVLHIMKLPAFHVHIVINACKSMRLSYHVSPSH